jgi:N-acetylmuramoyl-L-alanine amidase
MILMASMVYVTFIDDGHGLETPGKRSPFIPELGREIKENEFNAPVANQIHNELIRLGVQSYLTAPGDNDVPLKQRTDYANRVYNDFVSRYGAANVKAVFVSIHANALDASFGGADPNGIEIYVFTGDIQNESGKLARNVEKYLKQGTQQTWRGIKEANFAVLRDTNMPAILTENLYMDNKREALLMLNSDFQKEVAIEHVRGICDYFGISHDVSTNEVIGTVTINYPLGYGINAYDAPNGNFKKKVQGGLSYSVYAEKDGWFDLGNSVWVTGEYVDFKRYVIVVNYPSNYGVNVYDAPNGNYKGKVPSEFSYFVFDEQNGWFDIGQSTWIKSENVKLQK